MQTHEQTQTNIAVKPSLRQYDFLIVGSGLFGATFAHLMKHRGARCLVIDKRPTLGGNLYCEQTEGINVHKYGAHIFHTDNREVWDFVNRIVPFNRYTNSPIANYRGAFYNLPFNMHTFHQLWGVCTPSEAREIIDRQRREWCNGDLGRQPANLEEQALSLVGRDIYEKLIREYTEKQWGRKCTDLPASIIRRLPVRFVYDNNYFNDAYQGIPVGGYNLLISGLLEGIDTRTGIDFFDSRSELAELASTIVFTGNIDRYFDFSLGHLEWRTLRFESEVLPTANYQGNAVINYTSAEVPYTRIIEHKHFEAFGDEVYANNHTVITREYPKEWTKGDEAFYPINDERNTRLYEQYRTIAEQQKGVIFGGRLAEYKYYDMAPVIERAIAAANAVQL